MHFYNSLQAEFEIIKLGYSNSIGTEIIYKFTKSDLKKLF